MILQLGGPMDHSGPIPMVNDFGGMTTDSNFINQSPGQSGSNNNGNSAGSPSEFTGNFSEPQLQSEGLVW